MAKPSPDLLWQLTRKNTCFNLGSTRDGRQFSREPGNLLSTHARRYSMLCNARAVGVEAAPHDREQVQLVTRSDSGRKNKKNRKAANGTNSARLNRQTLAKGGARQQIATVGSVASEMRPDLVSAAKAKASAVKSASRRGRKVQRVYGSAAAAAAAVGATRAAKRAAARGALASE